MHRTARGFAVTLVVAALVVAVVGAPGPAPARADDATATATPYAGTGDAGYSGDGGPAVAATLDAPGGTAVGSDGVVYVADTANWVVRAIGTDGVISTITGQGRTGQGPPQTPVPADAPVPATDVTLRYPSSLAVDTAGTIYIGDSGNARILSLSPGGDVALVAGGNGAGFSGDGGPAVEAQLRDVSGLSVDADGGLALGDLRNYRVRRIDADGVIDTLIGSGDVGLVAGGDAGSFTFPYAPISTAVGPGGERWVASTLLYGLSDGRMRAVVRDGDSRWGYSESQSASIPADAWQGNLYVAATDDAVYLSGDDGVYRFYPDGRVEALLTDPGIVGPLTMVDDRTGYLTDPRLNRVYQLSLPELSDGAAAGGDDWWRQGWALAVAVTLAVALALVLAVAGRAAVTRRRRS